MITSIIAAILCVIGLILLFNLTPEVVTKDFLHLIGSQGSLKERSRKLRYDKNHGQIYKSLINIRTILNATGRTRLFAVVCWLAFILFGAGIFIALIIDNVFLMPVLCLTLAALPFLYATNTISVYNKQTKEELETALSIITSSYIRSDNIHIAVKENIRYIKPPLREIFQSFIGETSAINSNTRSALYNLKEKVDNEIFREWCDALILCQNDRTLKDTLQPIVSKLTDVKLVNNDLKTLLTSARNEYFIMVGMVIGSVPMMYFINKDWFYILINTIAGKITLGICAAVILITTLFMIKYTKPIEYKR